MHYHHYDTRIQKRGLRAEQVRCRLRRQGLPRHRVLAKGEGEVRQALKMLGAIVLQIAHRLQLRGRAWNESAPHGEQE